MPTTEDLALLKSLLDRLSSIGQAQRGELILAEDWNNLVDTVSTIARTVLGQEEAEEVPDHDHLDQVSVEWLVPLLRDQLQRGPLADPAMQSRLLAIEQQLRAIAMQMDGHRKDVEGFRGRLTDVVTRDIVRETAVTEVTRKVSALGDARTEVLDLRRSIGSVQNDLGTVVEAARRLEVDGQPADLGGLVTRLGSLESFRRSFVTATGQEMTASVIEQRLAENRNQFVTQRQLDDALEGRAGNISDDILAGLEDRLASRLRLQVNESFEGLAGQVRGEVDTRLNGVSDLIGSRINDAIPGVTRTITASLSPLIDRARQDAIATASTQAAERVAASEKALQTAIAQQGANLEQSFAATVRDQVSKLLPGELSGIRAEVATLTARADTLSTRTAAIESTQTGHAASIATLQQDAGRIRIELREMLQSELRLAIDAQTRDIATRFSAIQRDLSAQIEAISKDVRQQSIDAAKAAAVETAQAETRNIRTQMLAEIRLVAREEAGILVRDQLQKLNTGPAGPVRPGAVNPIINR